MYILFIEPAKRKIQKLFQPKKAMKLADIATNIIDNQIRISMKILTIKSIMINYLRTIVTLYNMMNGNKNSILIF